MKNQEEKMKEKESMSKREVLFLLKMVQCCKDVYIRDIIR